MPSPKVWLITGASTGFGRSMAENALKKGDKVVATMRKPEALSDLQSKFPSDQLLVVKLDVTQPQEIVDSFAKAKEAFGRIDVVFNNAGFVIFGETESLTEKDGRVLFETNFWGASNVMREAIRFFRDENPHGAGGRLLNNSSMVGFGVLPITSYYSASKFALEGLSIAFSKEIDPAWNIKITIVEPGATSTPIADKFFAPPIHPAYNKPDLPVVILRNTFQNALATGTDVNLAVEVLYKIVELENPPLRLPLGKDAVELVLEQLAATTADYEQYAHFSDNLTTIHELGLEVGSSKDV